MAEPTPPKSSLHDAIVKAVSEKRGQLDALLDVELVLDVATSPVRGDARPQAGGRLRVPASDDAPPTVDARARPSAADLAPGTYVGKYRLDRMLGAGGMGAVWDARDTDLDRRVALKVLRRDYGGDGVSRGRLVREARAMARLRHPNVITVFDAATLDGRDVISMELVVGETLASWLDRAHRPGEIVATLLAAGRGLAAAHAAGLIHRDFKPHNVLVDDSGRVVVTDFGLARGVGEAVPDTVSDLPSAPGDQDPHAAHGALDSPLTATGAVLGTPAYMAPEQLAGLVADERADQFSFCVTVWEAFAGRRPFPDDTLPAIAIAALASGERRDAERVPRRLRALLVRGLDLEPTARWPSMDALLRAITRSWRRPRRIAIALGIVALIASAAWLVMGARRAAPWRPEIVDLPAFEENSDGPAISPDGTQIAYVSDRERNGWFRAYLMPLSGGESRVITPPGESFQSPRWTRDGKALLLMRWDSVTYGYRLVRQPVVGGPFVDLGPALGADDCGDALAIAEADPAVSRLVLQRATGARTTLASSATQWIIQPRCDPSGQHILFTRGASGAAKPIDDLYVIDREGHEVALTHGNVSTNGAFTPDGRSVVFSSMRDDKVQLYEVATSGGPIHQLTFDNGPHLSPDVSPDGRTVAFDHDATSMIVLAGGGGPTRKLTSKREWLVGVTPTRDGAYLIAGRLGDSGGEVVVISTKDGGERSLGPGLHPFPSLDDRRVLFGAADPSHRLQSIAIEGGPVTSIAALPGNLVAGADGPDGQHVEVALAGKISAWHVGTDGRVEPDGAEGLVIPAPRGGWRAVRSVASGVRLRFVAPGAPLTASDHDVVGESTLPMWLDDHRIAYAAHGAFHVVDVTTGAEISTIPGPDWGELAIMAADGVHWYDVQLAGHVTRHLLVNFADRPWRF
jgi:serine/threonine protein kinase